MQVAIHHHDGLPAPVVDARRHGRLMPEVATELDTRHIAVPGAEGVEDRRRLVPAAVVDEQNLVSEIERSKRLIEPPVKLEDVFLLVEQRDDNADDRRSRERSPGVAHGDGA